MLTLTDRGSISLVSNTINLTMTYYFGKSNVSLSSAEIAGHGGLIATVSGYFILGSLSERQPPAPLVE